MQFITRASKCHLHRFGPWQTLSCPTILAPPTNSPTTNSPPLSTALASRRSHLIARHLSSSTGNMSYGKPQSEYSVRKIGAPYTLDFRAFIEKDGQPISPFHDIPLYANEQQTVLNMVVE